MSCRRSYVDDEGPHGIVIPVIFFVSEVSAALGSSFRSIGHVFRILNLPDGGSGEPTMAMYISGIDIKCPAAGLIALVLCHPWKPVGIRDNASVALATQQRCSREFVRESGNLFYTVVGNNRGWVYRMHRLTLLLQDVCTITSGVHQSLSSPDTTFIEI